MLRAIYAPAKDMLFYDEKNKDAYFEHEGRKQRISVSKRDKINEMFLIKSRSHSSQKLMDIIEKNKFGKIMTAGSSLKGCLVAKGDADVYFRLGPTNEWDICAMDIIVKEAGGMITDLHGKTISYNKKETLINGFVVSNNKIHDKFLEMI